MSRMAQKCLACCIAVLLPVWTGCIPLLVGAAVGAGGISYAKGALAKNVEHDLQDVHAATLKALKKLDLFVTADEVNKHDSKVHAEFQDGEKINIFLDAITEHNTKITIRIGVFGHQEKSQLILNAIELNL